jgi:hypothetical protein
VEGGDGLSVHSQFAKAAARFYGGQGGDRTVGFMKGDGFVDVAIGQAIAVSEQESLVFQVSEGAFEAAASLRFLSGVEQSHARCDT